MSITLVIGDRHPIVLDGLEHLFAQEADFVLLARCCTADEVVSRVRQERPDVLLFDVRMPEKDGLAALRELNQERLPTRIVLLTESLDGGLMIEAMRAGVRGVLLKSMDARLFIKCIRKVHAGGQWLEQEASGQALGRLLATGSAAADETLSKRETEVVRTIATGLSNREAAARLFISEGTIKVHLHRIYEKLQIDGRFALGVYARDNGLM